MDLLISKIPLTLITGFLLLSLGFSDPFKDLNIDFLLNETTEPKSTKKIKNTKKSKEKSFQEVVKDFQKIEGLFTLYWNADQNKAYIAILPEQLENISLAGLTRQSGDALFLDGSSMLNEYPFMFKRVGDRIQFINANVLFE